MIGNLTKLALTFFILLLSWNTLADNSPESIRFAKKLYTENAIRKQIDDLREFGIPMLRERLATRPIEQRERRLAMLPCVYIDANGNRQTWGLDLPMPDTGWATIKRLQNSTVATDATILRFEPSDSHQCWVAIAWQEKWLIVPAHGTVNCLTNAVVEIQIPEK